MTIIPWATLTTPGTAKPRTAPTQPQDLAETELQGLLAAVVRGARALPTPTSAAA